MQTAPRLKNSLRTFFQIVLVFVIGVALWGAAARAVPAAKSWWEKRHPPAAAAIAHEIRLPKSRLAPDEPDAFLLPADVIATLGVETATIEPAPSREPLRLVGQLILDADRLVHVHSRFAGDVVELGELTTADNVASSASDSSAAPTGKRQIRFGDRVAKGQLLAVVWSKDLGEKKSELVEHLSRLRLDEEKLRRLEELLGKGSVADRTVREAERDVEADLISVQRVERTLQSWNLTAEEIAVIRAEADAVRERKGNAGRELPQAWARVEVRAPQAGTIVEKNVAVGDFIASDLDIFKIADLSRLDVRAHAYEEDLPSLERLSPVDRRWTVTVKADTQSSPLSGSFDRIGSIIDPNQHTALVLGWVDNSRSKLRVGQFITAQIDLPLEHAAISVPQTAVIDQDGENYVFVVTGKVQGEGDANETFTKFSRRLVEPMHRREGKVCLRSPSRSSDATPDAMPPLQPGDLVVSVGGVELASELEILKAAARVTAAN